MSAEAKLAEFGITLPAPPTPAGLYAPCVRSGSLLYVSGQIPSKDGQMPSGYLGKDVTVEEGQVLVNTGSITQRDRFTTDQLTYA